jgi:DNA mismatch repair ATPase MutS
VKPHEIKKTIEKLEYKMKSKVKKEVEVRSFVIKRRVTKGFLERQALLKPFGFGTSEDDVRQNVNLTSVQRENVWHPYYEVKLEEEDLKEKWQRQKREKRDADIMGGEIADIETKLKQLEERERAEQQALLDSANATANPERKKPLFDLKKIQERKREEEK